LTVTTTVKISPSYNTTAGRYPSPTRKKKGSPPSTTEPSTSRFAVCSKAAASDCECQHDPSPPETAALEVPSADQQVQRRPRLADNQTTALDVSAESTEMYRALF